MAASDTFKSAPDFRDDPADHLALVTPSDADELSYVTRGLLVGTSGTLKVTSVGGETVTIPANCVVAGSIIPLRVKQVHDTGTTADEIVALW